MIRIQQTPNASDRSLAGFSQITFALLMLAGLAGCAGQSTVQDRQDTQAQQVDTHNGAPVLIRTVPQASYFIGEYELPVEDIRAQTKPLAEKVAVAAVRKAKLDIVGPLTLFLPDWRNQPGGFSNITLGVGYPVTGSGQLVPKFQQTVKSEFKCLSLTRESGSDNRSSWQALYGIAEKQGLEVSGDNRAVIRNSGDGVRIELQLGLL